MVDEGFVEIKKCLLLGSGFLLFCLFAGFD